jgi:ATP adenylyltransferase
VLLLNKFNVVPHHLLLVTREFAHQTEPLDAADCEALGAALRAFPPPGGLAFMNVGEASGFSQPHKHVQLVPLPFAPELPHAPVPVGPVLEQAAAEAGAAHTFHARALPFWNVCARLKPDIVPQQLAHTTGQLVAAARAATGATSYNVLLTASWLMVVPRAAERGKGVAVNSLGFAGTMLVRRVHPHIALHRSVCLIPYALHQVRTTEELERVRADPMAILIDAGFPW